MSRLMVCGVSAGNPKIYPARVITPRVFRASSISRYSVILFCRFFAATRLSGFTFSNPIKTRVTPARFAFRIRGEPDVRLPAANTAAQDPERPLKDEAEDSTA